MDREKVIKGLKCLMSMSDCTVCPYSYNKQREYCLCDIGKDAIELLKEQEAVVKQWTKEIADSQLAHAPNDYPMSLDEQLENEYKRGIWDGLQIAWNIISEGR